jgi:hypothetical protein
MDHKWGISICNTFRPYEPHTEVLFHSYQLQCCEFALIAMPILIQLFTVNADLDPDPIPVPDPGF